MDAGEESGFCFHQNLILKLTFLTSGICKKCLSKEKSKRNSKNMSYFIMLKLKDSGTGTSYRFIQKPTLCCKKKDNIMYFQWKEVGSRVSFTFVYLIGCFGWRFCLLGLVFLVGILRGRGIALGCRTKVDSMISTYTCNTKHFHKNAELEKISSEAFQQYTSIRTSVRPTISCELFMCLKNPIFFSLGLQ